MYWGWAWHPAAASLQIKGQELRLSPPAESGHLAGPEMVWKTTGSSVPGNSCYFEIEHEGKYAEHNFSPAVVIHINFL